MERLLTVWGFLKAYGDRLKKVGFFCTMGSSGADKAFADMAAAGGKEPGVTLALTMTQIRAGVTEQVKESLERVLEAV